MCGTAPAPAEKCHLFREMQLGQLELGSG